MLTYSPVKTHQTIILLNKLLSLYISQKKIYEKIVVDSWYELLISTELKWLAKWVFEADRLTSWVSDRIPVINWVLLTQFKIRDSGRGSMYKMLVDISEVFRPILFPTGNFMTKYLNLRHLIVNSGGKFFWIFVCEKDDSTISRMGFKKNWAPWNTESRYVLVAQSVKRSSQAYLCMCLQKEGQNSGFEASWLQIIPFSNRQLLIILTLRPKACGWGKCVEKFVMMTRLAPLKNLSHLIKGVDE